MSLKYTRAFPLVALKTSFLNLITSSVLIVPDMLTNFAPILLISGASHSPPSGLIDD